MVTFDVSAAFLYGKLKEELYMEVTNSDSEMYLLQKSLYGLQQPLRCWNERFKCFLSKFGFVESKADQCVYAGMVNECVVYLAPFVDDGLLTCKSVQVLQCILEALNQEFEITIGDASFFVGLEITRDRSDKSMLLSQSKYIGQIIKNLE